MIFTRDGSHEADPCPLAAWSDPDQLGEMCEGMPWLQLGQGVGSLKQGARSPQANRLLLLTRPSTPDHATGHVHMRLGSRHGFLARFAGMGLLEHARAQNLDVGSAPKLVHAQAIGQRVVQFLGEEEGWCRGGARGEHGTT